MTTFLKITDLDDGKINNFEGWETSVAKGFGVIVYTGNLFAAYSVDGGDTFSGIDLVGLCQEHGEKPLGDQVVIFIPAIAEFAWVILTESQNIILAIASPREIRESGGRDWWTWLIPAAEFGDRVSKFDNPSVGVGLYFLYITSNLGPQAIVMRISIFDLYRRAEIDWRYFIAPLAFFMRPSQNSELTAYFAVIKSGTYHEIRVFCWPEYSDSWTYFDVPIETIPTEDGVVSVPTGGDWLSEQKGALQILGCTETGTQLWTAWFANRRVPGQQQSFNYPHIGIAIIDVQSKQLVAQRYIWNEEYAFAYPALATNWVGDIGLSFFWGGGKKWSPQFGVGMLTGPDTNLYSVTSGDTRGSRGDYTTIRPGDSTELCAAGFIDVPGLDKAPQSLDHPRYVEFEAGSPP